MKKIRGKNNTAGITLLSLDTSTEACSVALQYQDQVTEEFKTGIRHSEIILSMVEKILIDNGLVVSQVDCVAFGRGPGMFTGLRIGAGVVQGIAFASDLPVLPISSLAILAQGQKSNKVMSALDARMNQVYWGLFEKDNQGLVRACIDEQVISPADIQLPESSGWSGAGSGWDQYSDTLVRVTGAHLDNWQAEQYPCAHHILPIANALYKSGKQVDANQAIPVYLRDNVAVKRSR